MSSSYTWYNFTKVKTFFNCIFIRSNGEKHTNAMSSIFCLKTKEFLAPTLISLNSMLFSSSSSASLSYFIPVKLPV